MNFNIEWLIATIRFAPTEITPRLMLLDACQEEETVVRAAIRGVMNRSPNLTHQGFGVYHRYDESPTEVARRVAVEREKLRDADVSGFAQALGWVVSRQPLPVGTNRSTDSYRMKHLCETEFSKDTGMLDYVSNGQLIAAAMWLGISVWKIPGGPYGYLSVSVKARGEREKEVSEIAAAVLASAEFKRRKRTPRAARSLATA